MRFIFALLLLWSASLFFPQASTAHIAGQPPFFLMNGEYADYYPVYTTSLSDFTLPQDLAPETYLVGEAIELEIDRAMLPFPPNIIDQITFSWDFGDGTKGSGLINTHAYSKPGSYLLTIQADYGDYSDENTIPVIQAVLLHVVPHEDYILPKPVIKVQGKSVEDPLLDSLIIKEGEAVQFDGSSSVAGSAPIVSYLWDRGDGTKNDDISFTYTYLKETTPYLFPILRVTDTNGFISDTYIQLEKVESTTSNKDPSNGSTMVPLLLGVLGLNAVVVGFIVILLRRR